MAWTNWGFDGTINEAQWAQMAGLLGNGYVAAGNGDCLVTAVGGARSVSVAAGTLYGDGVVSVNSGAETVAMTTPVNGQWYVIALRRTWATNTAALVAIAGATTTTTTPTAPPTSFPTLNTNVGVLTDQPIAWAWCNSANTTVVVYDIRLKAVKSLPPVVATQAERDAKFMTPTQGLQVWRDDLGAVETYYGLYNASTNPGGRDSAGWYATDRKSGLVPVRPTTVTIASGSGSANALGQISFTSATSIRLDGIFTAAYTNYKIVIEHRSSGYFPLYVRYSANGTPVTASYVYGSLYVGSNGAYGANSSTSTSAMNLSDCSPDNSGVVIDVFSPYLTTQTAITSIAYYGGGQSRFFGGNQAAATSHDGFVIYPGSGNITGTVQVFGYNK